MSKGRGYDDTKQNQKHGFDPSTQFYSDIKNKKKGPFMLKIN